MCALFYTGKNANCCIVNTVDMINNYFPLKALK